uniref:Uncharacterized protein n=1 Tax=Rhizophagus irregularis (strain DAOM 181602 / DAOM 197198 / MUCL 43194) TaxID=747089 RepID=U9ULJ3_RHIID
MAILFEKTELYQNFNIIKRTVVGSSVRTVLSLVQLEFSMISLVLLSTDNIRILQSADRGSEEAKNKVQ